jgi:hypothetical protein
MDFLLMLYDDNADTVCILKTVLEFGLILDNAQVIDNEK